MMHQDLITYYRERAQEYDKVYRNPPEQADLQEASRLFQALLAQKNVLEIACGTGYWTAQIAATAAAVDATDVNEAMLQIARSRPVKGKGRFEVADMYTLIPGKKYDAVFGGFIWSHIPVQDLNALLDRLANCLQPNGMLVFIDSNFVKNTPHDAKKIANTDINGNTYQARTLDNGDAYLVLKNFPDEAFLVERLARVGVDVSVVNLEYYWIAYCRVK